MWMASSTDPYASQPGRPALGLDHSFHVILNLAVGGFFPGNPDGTTVFPQTFTVNHVRVYAR